MLQTVERFLGRSNAENLATKMGLGAGCGAAIWENQNDHVRYEAPNNHTFSLYLKGGTGTRRLDAGKRSGWPGAVCVMPAGQSSGWKITQPFRFVHLYFSDTRLRSLFSEAHDCDARRLDLVEINFANKPDLVLPLAELARAVFSQNTLRAESAMADLVGELPGRKIHFLGGLAPHVLRRVDDYIEAYLATPIHLNDLASLANMSGFHFHRMFRLVRGCPPHAWVTRQRANRAKQLLRSDTPIAQIAVMCGFSNQSHLTRIFRNQTGQTPAQFRKLLRDT
ncbi:MAG: helix-turn-helix transcriptional regulator [Alteromonadaceae bacterium]|nr:helix-turn-helix transcriptional regulator [Alteromonadaceae bacterium]